MGRIFRIRYKCRTYKVSLDVYVYIVFFKCVLVLKRVKRNVCFYIKKLIPSLLVGVLWVIYIVSTYIIRKNILCIDNTCLSNYFWDARNSIFTSVVITVFLNIYNEHKKHKEVLVNQYNLYMKIKWSGVGLLKVMLNTMNVNGDNLCGDKDYFFNKETYQAFVRDMNNLIDCSGLGYITYIDDIKECIDRMTLELRELSEEINKNNIWCFSNYGKSSLNRINKYLDNLKKINKENNMKVKDYSIYFKNIYETFQGVIGDIRCPWIWDEPIHKKIRLKLNIDYLCMN